MSEEENRDDLGGDEQQGPKPASRFPEMDELQNDIARRIRDNQKFLDHFMDNDYTDEDDEDEDDEEIFEEL